MECLAISQILKHFPTSAEINRIELVDRFLFLQIELGIVALHMNDGEYVLQISPTRIPAVPDTNLAELFQEVHGAVHESDDDNENSKESDESETDKFEAKLQRETESESYDEGAEESESVSFDDEGPEVGLRSSIEIIAHPQVNKYRILDPELDSARIPWKVPEEIPNLIQYLEARSIEKVQLRSLFPFFLGVFLSDFVCVFFLFLVLCFLSRFFLIILECKITLD